MVILSDSQQPTTLARLLINHGMLKSGTEYRMPVVENSVVNTGEKLQSKCQI